MITREDAILEQFRQKGRSQRAGYFLIDGIKVAPGTFRRWVGWMRAALARGEDMSTPTTWRNVLDDFAERIGWDIETDREARDALRRAQKTREDVIV